MSYNSALISKLNIVSNEIKLSNEFSDKDKDKHLYFIAEIINFVQRDKHGNRDSSREFINMHCMLMDFAVEIQMKNDFILSKYMETDNVIREFLFGENKVVYKQGDTERLMYLGKDYYRSGQHTSAVKGRLLKIKIPKDISIEMQLVHLKDNDFKAERFRVGSGEYIVKVIDGYNSSIEGGLFKDGKPYKNKMARGLKVSLLVSKYIVNEGKVSEIEYIRSIEDFHKEFNFYHFDFSINDDWMIELIDACLLDNKVDKEIEDISVEDLLPWQNH
jgi:hypothetical protein